jgi:hypothetical protein
MAGMGTDINEASCPCKDNSLRKNNKNQSYFNTAHGQPKLFLRCQKPAHGFLANYPKYPKYLKLK